MKPSIRHGLCFGTQQARGAFFSKMLIAFPLRLIALSKIFSEAELTLELFDFFPPFIKSDSGLNHTIAYCISLVKIFLSAHLLLDQSILRSNEALIACITVASGSAGAVFFALRYR